LDSLNFGLRRNDKIQVIRLAQNNFEIDAARHRRHDRRRRGKADIDIAPDQSLNQSRAGLDQHHVCCQTVFLKEASLLRHPRRCRLFREHRVGDL
jgi:hypothetical protein